MKRWEDLKENRKKELYEAVLLLESADECQAFFADLCTPAELEALSDRFRVAKLLVKKTPYRKISEDTGVSVTTVTRVARFLFSGNSGYKVILKRLGVM